MGSAPSSQPVLKHASHSNSSTLIITNPPLSEFEGFFISEHSVQDNGVVYYHVRVRGKIIKRRFNDFKAFHKQCKRHLTSFPPMPSAGLMTYFNRTDSSMIEERCVRFQRLLNLAPDGMLDKFFATQTRRKRRWKWWKMWQTRALGPSSMKSKQDAKRD